MKIPLAQSARAPGSAGHAFTLLEVMIAIGIFFVAIFAILELTSRSLNSARALQATLVDPASIAAEYSLTNQLVEGPDSGFSEDYPDVKWERNVTQISSNGLYKVDFRVSQTVDRRLKISELSILLYRPDSVQGANTGTGAGGASGTQTRSR